MHLREVLAAGGATWSDTMHIVFTSCTVVLMLLAMGFGAAALGKPFRIYTILTMLLPATFGALTSSEVSGVDVNGPTPWIGVYERVHIGVPSCGSSCWPWCYCLELPVPATKES